MKQERVNVKVAPDVRRSKNDERFSLKLRITCKGLRKYYAVTTYVARHSYATILVQSGAPLKLASATLGHQSLITTEQYFARV